ncbi:MAG TPA: hypothetical protein VII58_01075, partial [Acidobacteriaceae bacterium]
MEAISGRAGALVPLAWSSLSAASEDKAGTEDRLSVSIELLKLSFRSRIYLENHVGLCEDICAPPETVEMRSKICLAFVLAVLLNTPFLAHAQAISSGDTNLQKEADTARTLYEAQNFVAALPLYEDLHKRDPQSNVYREGLAMCLLGATAANDAEKTAHVQRAHQLLLDARAAGDNSGLLQTLLEKLDEPAPSGPAGPPSPGTEAFQRAEKAFSSGDLPNALKAYMEAAAADPKLYEAPLYAGDTEFKQHHYPEANQWYAKAAAIDPDRETAWRYWGDNLMKQGDSLQAETKYINAIIAQPYQRTPRLALQQWADATHALLAPPPIKLPARAQPNPKGGTQIT